jgi:hypothetical protein
MTSTVLIRKVPLEIITLSILAIILVCFIIATIVLTVKYIDLKNQKQTCIKGDKGDPGVAGPQGPQGIQGVQGPTGPMCSCSSTPQSNDYENQ